MDLASFRLDAFSVRYWPANAAFSIEPTKQKRLGDSTALDVMDGDPPKTRWNSWDSFEIVRVPSRESAAQCAQGLREKVLATPGIWTRENCLTLWDTVLKINEALIAPLEATFFVPKEIVTGEEDCPSGS